MLIKLFKFRIYKNNNGCKYYFFIKCDYFFILNMVRFKANIHSGKFQTVRYGTVWYVLFFSQNNSCSREELFSERTKENVPYPTVPVKNFRSEHSPLF